MNFRSAAARQRRRKRRTKNCLQEKDFPTFNPLSAIHNPQIKRPKRSYLIHNISDRRESTYTCQSSMPTVESPMNKARNSLPMSTFSSKDNSMVMGPTTIRESSTKKHVRLTSSHNQKSAENTDSPASNRQEKNRSKLTPRVPRKNRIAIQENDHSGDANVVPMRRNEVERTTRSSISSVRSSTIKKRRRSQPIHESTDDENRSGKRSSRLGTVTVRKLRRLSKSVQPMPDHDRSKSIDNHVKVTAAKRN